MEKELNFLPNELLKFRIECLNVLLELVDEVLFTVFSFLIIKINSNYLKRDIIIIKFTDFKTINKQLL